MPGWTCVTPTRLSSLAERALAHTRPDFPWNMPCKLRRRRSQSHRVRHNFLQRFFQQDRMESTVATDLADAEMSLSR